MRIFCILALLIGCATSPKGEKELFKKIEEDQKKEAAIRVPINQGRPIYVEVAAYAQLLPSGDIWTGGVILLNVGRETLELSSLVHKYKEKKQ